MSGNSGKIATPNYPTRYPNDVHITTVISTDPGTRIAVYVKELSIEFQFDCLYDYLSFKNSNNESDTIKLCGHKRTSK